MSESRLEFEVANMDGLTVGRLLTEFGAGVVERHWDGLHRPWPEDRDRNPFFTHGVNNNNREEVAVYLGLAWALTEGRDRWAIPVNGLEDVRKWYGREDFDLVRWDYHVDAEQADWSARDRGFTKATYPVDRDQLRGPTSAGAGRPAGVYAVRNRRELTDLMVACLGDVWSTVVVFGVDPDSGMPVHERLRDRRRPTLRHVVGPRESFVVVIIGADLGYYDSVLVAADGDRRDEFERVFDLFRRRINTYEATLDSIQSTDEFLRALDFLQGRLMTDNMDGLDNMHR
jgi:hypothetical protein